MIRIPSYISHWQDYVPDLICMLLFSCIAYFFSENKTLKGKEFFFISLGALSIGFMTGLSRVSAFYLLGVSLIGIMCWFKNNFNFSKRKKDDFLCSALFIFSFLIGSIWGSLQREAYNKSSEITSDNNPQKGPAPLSAIPDHGVLTNKIYREKIFNYSNKTE